jgi:XTP/dITP diphosphohydrolase
LIKNGQNYLFEGTIEGTIIHEPMGEKGFGYDPIFVPNGYDITFAQMDAELKNKISHRALATKKLINFLQTI